MMFESTWWQYADDQGLRNLKVLQQDPCFGAGVFHLVGLHPTDNPQLQARLHPSILVQARHLGMQALLKVADMVTPTQRYSTIKQGPNEPYLQFIERL